MFTSRAEHRLLLRHDNADLRLSQIGYDVGVLGKSKLALLINKTSRINNELERLDAVRHEGQKLSQLLRRPEMRYRDLPSQDGTLSDEILQQVEIATKYAGYIGRQQVEAAKLKSVEAKQIPADLDYTQVNGLRSEAKQKLQAIRPANLGQAARISGVTPSDISVLMVWLRRAGERPPAMVDAEA
jgi:tRNA uridine 5-carboxymethylaminomethyl modification enzyme